MGQGKSQIKRTRRRRWRWRWRTATRSRRPSRGRWTRRRWPSGRAGGATSSAAGARAAAAASTPSAGCAATAASTSATCRRWPTSRRTWSATTGASWPPSTRRRTHRRESFTAKKSYRVVSFLNCVGMKGCGGGGGDGKSFLIRFSIGSVVVAAQFSAAPPRRNRRSSRNCWPWPFASTASRCAFWTARPFASSSRLDQFWLGWVT